jgi:hypothetical protein
MTLYLVPVEFFGDDGPDDLRIRRQQSFSDHREKNVPVRRINHFDKAIRLQAKEIETLDIEALKERLRAPEKP